MFLFDNTKKNEKPFVNYAKKDEYKRKRIVDNSIFGCYYVPVQSQTKHKTNINENYIIEFNECLCMVSLKAIEKLWPINLIY